MRVALLFDGESAIDTTPDLLIIQTVEAIETALVNEGNAVVRVPVSNDVRDGSPSACGAATVTTESASGISAAGRVRSLPGSAR